MKSPDNFFRCRKRIILPENRVRCRNRRFADDPSVMHVAEVDDARHASWLRPRRAYQHVMIVRIAVDDTPSKFGPRWFDPLPKKRQKIFDEHTPMLVGNFLHVLANPACTRGIPFQL